MLSNYSMRYIPLLIALTFAGCHSAPILKKLATADKVEIRFGTSQSDVIEKYINTTNKDTIKKMEGFLTDASTIEFNCGSDGKLIFFAAGEQLETVDFRMYDKNCNHFSYLLDGKLTKCKMSDDAADFLLSLRGGK